MQRALAIARRAIAVSATGIGGNATWPKRTLMPMARGADAIAGKFKAIV
jgi:hypothetical protein